MSSVLADDKGMYTIKSQDERTAEKQTLALLLASGKSPEEAVEIIRKAEQIYTESELSKKRSRNVREIKGI